MSDKFLGKTVKETSLDELLKTSKGHIKEYSGRPPMGDHIRAPESVKLYTFLKSIKSLDVYSFDEIEKNTVKKQIIRFYQSCNADINNDSIEHLLSFSTAYSVSRFHSINHSRNIESGPYNNDECRFMLAEKIAMSYHRLGAEEGLLSAELFRAFIQIYNSVSFAELMAECAAKGNRFAPFFILNEEFRNNSLTPGEPGQPDKETITPEFEAVVDHAFLAKAVRDARKSAKMTQADLAAMSNVSLRQITRVEKADESASLDTGMELLRKLGKSVVGEVIDIS